MHLRFQTSGLLILAAATNVAGLITTTLWEDDLDSESTGFTFLENFAEFADDDAIGDSSNMEGLISSTQYGQSSTGGMRVSLYGANSIDTGAGFETTIDIGAQVAANGVLSFHYYADFADGFLDGEVGIVTLQIDDDFVTVQEFFGSDTYVTPSWRTYEYSIGGLAAGSHTISVGAVLGSNEGGDDMDNLFQVRFDNFELTGDIATPAPSAVPTAALSDAPSAAPTKSPSDVPTLAPTVSPAPTSVATVWSDDCSNAETDWTFVENHFEFANDDLFGETEYIQGLTSNAKYGRWTNGVSTGGMRLRLAGCRGQSEVGGAFETTLTLAEPVFDAVLTLDFHAKWKDGWLDNSFHDDDEAEAYLQVDDEEALHVLGSYSGSGDTNIGGWNTLSLSVGSLTPGTHTLRVGGMFRQCEGDFENRDNIFQMRFDNFVLSGGVASA